MDGNEAGKRSVQQAEKNMKDIEEQHKKIIEDLFETTENRIRNKIKSDTLRKTMERRLDAMRALQRKGTIKGVEQCKQCPLFVNKPPGPGLIGTCKIVARKHKTVPPYISGDCAYFWRQKLADMVKGTDVSVMVF